MSAPIDQKQLFLYDLGGETVEVARSDRDAFLRENPGAERVHAFDLGGETVEVAERDLAAFGRENPGARRVHLFDEDGGTVEVEAGDLRAFVADKAGPDRMDKAGSFLGDVAQGAREVARAPDEAVAGLSRRVVAAPALLAGQVAEAVNPSRRVVRDVISGEKVAAPVEGHKPGPAARLAGRAREWLARADAAAAPETPAGKAAAAVSGAAAAMGGYALSAPAMILSDAAQGGERALSEGESGADALLRAGVAGGVSKLAFGAKPLRVPGAAAARNAAARAAARGLGPGSSPLDVGRAAERAVEGAARMGAVAAAQSGGDAGETLGAAAMGGLVGGVGGAFAGAREAPGLRDAAIREQVRRQGARVRPERAIPERFPEEPPPPQPTVGAPPRPSGPGLPPRESATPAERARARAAAAADTSFDFGFNVAPADAAPPAPEAAPIPDEPPPPPQAPAPVEESPVHASPRPGVPAEPTTDADAIARRPEKLYEVRNLVVAGKVKQGERVEMADGSVVVVDGTTKSGKPRVRTVKSATWTDATGRRRGGHEVGQNLGNEEEFLDNLDGIIIADETPDLVNEYPGEKRVYVKELLVGRNVVVEARPVDQKAFDAWKAERLASEAAPPPAPGAPTPGTPPAEPLVLDGGTPAEIDAERGRAAAAAKRAALEEAAAAPGPDLGTVSVQEGLPGIGGDGTLFTPPPGGWSSPSSGGALADAAGAPEPMISLASRGALDGDAPATAPDAAARPSSGSVAADAGQAPREGPAATRRREDAALVSEALDACRRHRDGDLSAEELLGYAERLEARSLYGSAALVRRAAGDAALRPGLSTEGAHALWPAQEPGVLRVSLMQLVDIATKLGGGVAPVVSRRLRALRGRALGYYDPGFGRGMVALKASLAQLVDAEERARIRSEVLAGGGSEEDYRAAVRERVRQNMLDDAPAAAQVLAHEIGHWIDDLPELGGALRGRGNVLGHIATLKHYLSKTLFLDPKKHGGFDWDGDAIPGMTKEERAAIVREAERGLKRADFASDEDFAAAKKTARREALENAMIERGLAKYEVVRGELDDLIAWYRQSDHAPKYFQKPWEMFAEAFSAWLYYPRTAAAKAPTFCRLIEAWGPKKGEAWAAVREAQTRGGGFEAALGNVNVNYLKRFRERMRAATTAYYAIDGHRLPDLRNMGEKWRDFYGDALAVFAGELRWVDWASRKLERRLTGSDAQDGWGTSLGAAARASVHEYLHASTLAEYELTRFRTEVLPILEQGGATITDLDVYLTLNRVAREVLGAEAQGGRANLLNPGGLTPASARALLAKWEQDEPVSFAAAKAAQERFAAIRRETVLPFAERQAGIGEAEMDEMLENDAYARFLQLFAPRAGRAKAARGEMRTGSGIRHQHTGFLAQNVSPSLATLMGDGQIYFDSGLNGARRDAVALLREAFPEAVRLAPMKWDPAAKALVPDQTRGGGWRTVVFRERGEDGRSRVVGYDLRDWAAVGLRGVEGGYSGAGARFLRALDALGGFSARSTTALAWGFNLLNPFRDRSGMLRNAPAPEGAGAAEKWLGDVPAAAKSLVNGAGRARQRGDEAHPLLMEALKAGAMPGGDFSGWSFNKTAARALENLLRAGGDEKAMLAAADEVVRSLGLDPALVGAQRRTWGVLGDVFRRVSSAWMWLPGRLARTETNAKAAGYAAVRRAHPDWDPRRAAEFAARYIGTPDPQAPGLVAQIPGFRLLSMFYTMTTRGIGDQILGAGRLQPGLMARRLIAHVAMRQMLQNSWWWLVGVGAAGGGLVGALRNAAAPGEGDDEDEAYYKRGLSETADALEWFAKAQRAASPFDRAQGYLVPLFTVDERTGKYAYLKIPYDQSLYPIDAIADYAASSLTGMRNFTATAFSDAVAGSAIPSAGPGLRQIGVWLGGTDLGSGNRSIHPNEDRGPAEHAWDHLATAWDIWTGRGFGVLPARGGFAATWTDESRTPLERLLAVPGINNTVRPFLRVSNQGDAETARMVQRAVEANKRAERRAATALSRGEEPDAADVEALSRYSTDPGDMVRHAWERDYMRTNAPPSLRALETAPRRMVPDLMREFSIRP